MSDLQPRALRPADVLALPQPRFIRPADLLEDGLAVATLRHQSLTTGKALGPAVPCSPKLSRAMGGHFWNGLTILHGPPGSAKTALANQLAAEAECPALIVTCEMDPLELLERHAARATQTFVSKFWTGQLAPSEWLTLMRRTVKTMPQLAFLDGTCAPITLKTLRAAAEATRGASPHLLIVIDSMHAWLRGSGVLGNATEYDAIGQGLESLRSMAKELSCAVLVIAEQNRASMGSDRQEAARGSGVFEYLAICVISLTREPDAQPDDDGEIPITATVPKTRHGQAGARIDLRFAGRFMGFREGDGTAIVSRKNSKA